MAVTFRITHVMRVQEGDRERLKTLVNDSGLALDGTGALNRGPEQPDPEPSRNAETPADAGVSGNSWGETRTPDLTIMSGLQRSAKSPGANDSGDFSERHPGQMRFDWPD